MPSAARAARTDGPRERLASLGAAALSDAELIALLLRTGDRFRDALSLAREVLGAVGGLRGLGATASRELVGIRGLGPAKAASLHAALELARRWAAEPIHRGRPLRSPLDVHRDLEPRLRDRDRESFHVVLLDGRHRPTVREEVSVGTLTASLVHPREVFRSAIRAAAAAVVLVHHHPSGDPSPSAEDRAVTQRLRSAGELVGIPVVDHVIVAEDGYYSFRESDPGFALPERRGAVGEDAADGAAREDSRGDPASSRPASSGSGRREGMDHPLGAGAAPPGSALKRAAPVGR